MTDGPVTTPVASLWDVFRKCPRDEVWAREGFQIEAESATAAAQRIADELPDHLLREPLLVVPSDAVETFLTESETETHRTVAVIAAEPAAFNEHKGFRFPRWYKRKEQAGV